MTPMKTFALSLLFATTLSLSPVAARETSLSGNFLASRSAALSRDNQAAALFLGAALKLDPGNPNMIERLFQIELANGNLPASEKLAADVIEFNSQHRMARIVLAMQEFSARRYDKAREHLTESNYTPAGELTATLLSAWSYAGEGSLNAALTELDKLDANESFANFKNFHAALISDYLNSSIRAEVFYKKAYQDAGSSLRVTQSYGSFLERNNRPEEARKIYEAFLSGGETNNLVEAALKRLGSAEKAMSLIATPSAGAGEALFSLAAAMNDDQGIDTALLFAQLALNFSEDKPVMLTLLGDIFSTSRNYELANAAYARIPASSPLRIHADTEIAVNLQRLERGKESIEQLQSIVKRDPTNYAVWVTLGSVYRSTDDYIKAAEAYDAALKLVTKPERGHWTVFYFRGIANERQKQWPLAEADFRKALELAPDESSVLNYLGYSLIDKNEKLDEAIAMVKKAVELKPNDGYIVDSLGWAYFQLRDFENAVEQLERAVDLKAGDPIIAEHLGDAYWRVGRTLEAKFQWQHAKDNKPEPEDLKRIEGKLKDGMPELPPLVKPADNSGTGSSNG